MRSRAFFFTTVTIIGIAFIAGLVYLVKNVGSGFTREPAVQERNHIRMNKTVRGTVTDVMQSANLVTIVLESGQEVHLAIVPETRMTDEKGSSVDLSQIYKGSVVEGRGESASLEAMIAGELRVISTPEIVIVKPTGIDPVASPLVIEGLAKGVWYFEAVFPVTITDAQHRSLGQSYVTATKDWMSESLVPFTATIEFTQPTTVTGYLVFKNANPSDLRENDKMFEMPIVFTPQTKKVKVFFNNSKLDSAFLCDTVFPVFREIPWTEGIGRAAIEELLRGPSEQEKSSSYFTNIAPNVRINSLTIENGTAKIDFSEELGRNIGGSCRVTAIRAQITQTLKQFPTVEEVAISINGKMEDILQP